jgi:hypothetical protein
MEVQRADGRQHGERGEPGQQVIVPGRPWLGKQKGVGRRVQRQQGRRAHEDQGSRLT